MTRSLDGDASNDASMDELIGEARAALDGRPSAAMWSRVLDLADACAPESLGELIDFLEPQTSRWDMKPTSRWAPKKARAEGSPEDWIKAIPEGELRVAPHHWLIAMIAKRDSPKYRLAHSIHLTGLKVNGTKAAALLAREDLTNLRVLDLGGNKLSASFWKKLRKSQPSTRRLEHLNFTALDAKSVEGARGPHHLEALRELSFRADEKSRNRGVLQTLLETDLAQSVPILTVRGSSVEDLVDLMSGEVHMPNLTQLGARCYIGEHVNQLLASDAARRIGHVNLAFNLWFYSFIEGDDAELSPLILDRLEGWTRGGVDGPAHLDLSGLSIDDAKSSIKERRDALARAMSAWTLPTATTSMSFGRWYSTDLKKRLAERGVSARR